MYDHELGERIHQLLIKEQLENPVDFGQIESWSNPKVQAKLADQLGNVFSALGLYLGAEKDKVAKRWLNFLCKERFSGLNYAKFPSINRLPNQFNYHEPLIAEGIKLRTTCEHHLLPILGEIKIAYLPKDYLVGLNKLNGVASFFAARPQLQERLTRQLAVTLRHILLSDSVAVVIKARHECMYSGDVTDNDSYHTTFALSGCFASDTVLKQKMLAF